MSSAKKLLHLGLLAMLCSVLAFTSCEEEPGRELRVPGRGPDPPILLALPSFELVDQAGQRFGSEQLRGKVWVANFIFTRCVVTCPVQTALMAKLQERLRANRRWDDIALVSFSVDPEYDTPGVLAEFGSTYDADFEHWRFLTGERERIWDLSKNGFKLAVEERPMEVGMPLFHAAHLVLVDGDRRIRGFYDGMTDDELDEVCDDVERVLEEQGPG